MFKALMVNRKVKGDQTMVGGHGEKANGGAD